MKKLLLLTGLLFTLTACDAYDGSKCYESVKKAYPDAEISLIPNDKFTFLVKTPEGDIIYVQTMNLTNTEISQAFTAFRGDK